jgi:hypothetical protein
MVTQFALDTGTPPSAITPQLGVASSPIGAATTGGAQADSFARLSTAVGAKLDGIVGYNFLRNYKVALDYPNETLSLFTP